MNSDGSVIYSQRATKCNKCGMGDQWWYHNVSAPRGQVWTLRTKDGTAIHSCRPNIAASVSLAPAAAPVENVRKNASAEDADLTPLIPDIRIYNSYIPRRMNGSTDIEVVIKAMQHGLPILCVGDTGTGKTHLLEAACAYLKKPNLTISGSAGITVDDFVGVTGLKDGHTEFIYGAAPRMMRAPGNLTIDEINGIPQEISFSLHAVTDDRRTLVITQNGGEVVVAKPEFSFAATMNPDYKGTKPLNEAMKNRFAKGIVLYLDYDPQVENQLIGDKRLLNMAEQLRRAYRDGEVSDPTSTRALIGYEQNVRLFGDTIARMSFLALYEMEERAAIRQIMEVHLDAPSGTRI